jgi:hypothetical protein
MAPARERGGIALALLAAAGLLLVSGAAGIGVWYVYREMAGTSPPAPLSAQAQRLHALRERETHLLNGYGWVDREAAIARIPIREAMIIIGQRGWDSVGDGRR